LLLVAKQDADDGDAEREADQQGLGVEDGELDHDFPRGMFRTSSAVIRRP
jgi:hypothetical protein